MDATSQRPPLRRPTDDRMVAGVCAGIARTLGIEPVIVRVIVAVLAVLGGSGIALYIIGWLLIPADETGASIVNDPKRSTLGRAALIGIVVFAGLSALGIDTGAGDFGFLELLVIVLLIIGLYQWWNSRQDRGWTPATGSAPAGPAGEAPKQQSGGPLGAIVLGLLAIAIGGVWFADVANWYDPDTTQLLAIGLAIIGLGLLVGAFTGNARWLIWLAIPFILIAHLSANVTRGVDASIGDRTWRPTSVAELQQPFTLGVGDATLDLGALDASALAGRRIEASLSVGTLRVITPVTTSATVTTRVALGTSRIEDVAIEGSGLQRTAEMGDPALPHFDLDLEVGVGTIEVYPAMTLTGTVVG